MRYRTWNFHQRLAIGLIWCLALSPLRADDTKPAPPVNDPPDPPGTTLIMGQLRLLFNMWDVNKDGFLDKQELAWAFRGPDAKPYDYDAKTDKTKTTSTDKTTDPTPDKPADKPDDSSGSGLKPMTPTKKVDYAQYPDYLFLTQLDTDADGMISRAEFMTWARGYATQLKAQNDALQKIAQLQAQLANPKLSAADMKKLQADLKKAQAAQTKLANQAKTFENSVSQQLTKKKS